MLFLVDIMREGLVASHLDDFLGPVQQASFLATSRVSGGRLGPLGAAQRLRRDHSVQVTFETLGGSALLVLSADKERAVWQVLPTVKRRLGLSKSQLHIYNEDFVSIKGVASLRLLVKTSS